MGISANQWTKGSSKTQLMFVASQWDAVLVKPPSKKVKKGERIMIRDIDKVIMGYGDGESAEVVGLTRVGFRNASASFPSSDPHHKPHSPRPHEEKHVWQAYSEGLRKYLPAYFESTEGRRRGA